MSQDQRFRELQVHDIEEFVRRREPETIHLEFKTVPEVYRGVVFEDGVKLTKSNQRAAA